MRLASLLALQFVIITLSAQNLNLAFYNVENLFHPSVDSLNTDKEFTPMGSKSWDTAKYYTKLNQISKVILALGDATYEPPSLIGFAELESSKVLDDLIHRPALKKVDYQWVHYDSPDRRGIDVGLIYRKGQLKLIKSEPLRYFNESEPNYTSRDILYAQFTSLIGDTLNIFVCHWPSRYGGKEKSQPRRIAAAHVLLSKIETLGKGAKVIVMGDFNDEPSDESLNLLEVKASMQVLMKTLDPSIGSHRYKGHWAYLDQFVVSENLKTRIDTFNTFKAPFLLQDDDRYPGKQVYRSFKGNFFQGGFSDHLPIFLLIK